MGNYSDMKYAHFILIALIPVFHLLIAFVFIRKTEKVIDVLKLDENKETS